MLTRSLTHTILGTAAALLPLFLAAVGMTALLRAAPPGDQLAYLSNCDGDWDVYLLDVRHGASINLSRNTAQENAFAWSPDGSEIGYAYYDGAIPYLYIYNFERRATRAANLSADTWLIGAAQTRDVRGDWSRDGQRRIYELAGQLYVWDRLSRTTEPITADRFMNTSPSWSPDESQIVFASDRGGGYDLYTMALDGSGLRRLTEIRGAVGAPDWSPDGRTIAFVALESGASEIYAMDSSGNGSRRLTWNTCSDIRLTWRPS
jgi:TolB protein